MKNINITDRHKQIIEWSQEGTKASTIARWLGISVHTVRSHKRTAYNRLNVHSNDDAWLKIKEMESSGR
jgi:DNA-binding NarL/FixJ family response regulator